MQTSETIRAAIAAGITVCGENRAQEFTQHWQDGAYEGAKVHFIGHLQKNKLKYLVGKVDLIESVDSEELIRLIDKRAQNLGIVQDILIEVNIGGEASKSGVKPGGSGGAGGFGGLFARCGTQRLDGNPPCGAGTGGQSSRFCRNATAFY